MKKNIILLIVSSAMFMESVDTTVLNTAIPSMAHSLQVNPISLKLALISYLLSLAIFIPISGWVADKYGIKKVFITAVAVFTLSSIACGFTNSLPQLIIGRILQGLGGSLTMPVGRLIIMRTFQRHELISKMGVVVMVAALGMMLGPVLGGIITNHFSWHWIFWINAPIGLIAILLASILLPHIPPIKVGKLDKLGFLIFGTSLALLTLGLSTLGEAQVAVTTSARIIGISFLLLAIYIGYSRKKAHPVVKLELLKIRTFRVAIIGNLLARIGFGGLPFVFALMLQIILGYSPQSAGFLLAPTALGIFVLKPFSLHILRFYGYKKLLTFNTLLVSLVLGSFSFIDQHSTIHFIASLSFAYGFLMSLQLTGMNTLAYAKVSQDDISSATSLMSTTQQLSQSFGVAIAAIIISYFSGSYAGHQVLTLSVFHKTFMVLGILTLCTAPWFLQLKSEDGQEMIRAREI